MAKYKQSHIERLSHEVLLFQKEMMVHLEEIGKTPQGRASISYTLGEHIYYSGITGYPAEKIQDHWTYDELAKVLLLLLEGWSPKDILSSLNLKREKNKKKEISHYATQPSSTALPSLSPSPGISNSLKRGERAIRRSVRTLTRRSRWRDPSSMS